MQLIDTNNSSKMYFVNGATTQHFLYFPSLETPYGGGCFYFTSSEYRKCILHSIDSIKFSPLICPGGKFNDTFDGFMSHISNDVFIKNPLSSSLGNFTKEDNDNYNKYISLYTAYAMFKIKNGYFKDMPKSLQDVVENEYNKSVLVDKAILIDNTSGVIMPYTISSFDIDICVLVDNILNDRNNECKKEIEIETETEKSDTNLSCGICYMSNVVIKREKCCSFNCCVSCSDIWKMGVKKLCPQCRRDYRQVFKEFVPKGTTVAAVAAAVVVEEELLINVAGRDSKGIVKSYIKYQKNAAYIEEIKDLGYIEAHIKLSSKEKAYLLIDEASDTVFNLKSGRWCLRKGRLGKQILRAE